MSQYKRFTDIIKKAYQETKEEFNNDREFKKGLPTINDFIELLKLVIILFFVMDIFIFAFMTGYTNFYYLVPKCIKLLTTIIIIEIIECTVKTIISKLNSKYKRHSK